MCMCVCVHLQIHSDCMNSCALSNVWFLKALGISISTHHGTVVKKNGCLGTCTDWINGLSSSWNNTTIKKIRVPQRYLISGADLKPAGKWCLFFVCEGFEGCIQDRRPENEVLNSQLRRSAKLVEQKSLALWLLEAMQLQIQVQKKIWKSWNTKVVPLAIAIQKGVKYPRLHEAQGQFGEKPLQVVHLGRLHPQLGTKNVGGFSPQKIILKFTRLSTRKKCVRLTRNLGSEPE